MADEDPDCLGSFAETQMDGMSASGAKRPEEVRSWWQNGPATRAGRGRLLTLAV